MALSSPSHRGSRLLTVLVAATLALACAQRAARADGAPPAANDPMAAVKATIDDATTVFRQKEIPAPERRQKLRAMAEQRFDFDAMARSAVGYHWRSLTPEQRAEFVPLFTRFIEDVYLSRMEEYSVEKIQQNMQASNVRYVREAIDDSDDARVFTTVALKTEEKPVQVNYLLRREPSGEWKIYDITIDAISVIANYRNQFNRVINNEGYDKLVSILKQKQQTLGPALDK
jgi:phospholipid transport system substrate-binding protein